MITELDAAIGGVILVVVIFLVAGIEQKMYSMRMAKRAEAIKKRHAADKTRWTRVSSKT